MKLITMTVPAAIPDAVAEFTRVGLSEFDVISVLPTGPTSSAIIMRVPEGFNAPEWQADGPAYRKRMMDAARRWRRGEPELLVLQ